jgi:ribosomal protein S12 methylthiotransferase
MLGTLMGSGWISVQEPEIADAIVINTCGFIGSAKEESIDTILQATELKKSNSELKVVVTGCLTQRYKSQLARGLPEVDLFIGTDEFTKIGKFIEDLSKSRPQAKQANSDNASNASNGAGDATLDVGAKVHAKRTHYLYSDDMPRLNTLAKHSAYVKVAEGCQHQCSFCIIPAIRGRLRSRPIESIVREVNKLVHEGVLEVNLIAQDLAAYGREQGEDRLIPLLKELIKIDGLKWIRCLYVYPENLTDELIDLFATEAKLAPYIDIPVQHASNRILKAMNRAVNRQDLENTLARLRQRVPHMAIRTSVMVGFPGETDGDFDELVDFVEQQKFDHLGVFAYSQEEGTVAGRMKEQVAQEIKQDRLDTIMKLQRAISKRRLEDYVGKVFACLVEGISKESEFLWEGRLATQAPEVDGVVYINDGDELTAGKIQYVEITESHDYDLVGRVISKNSALSVH